MKFANISMQRNGLNNLGDNMQLLAIENLYRYMNIPTEDIVRIDYYDLTSYSGEYVILPINYPFYGYKDDMSITMFSDKIIPVFIGLSLMAADFKEEELEYMKRFAPIGCRDEYTMNQLRKRGIPAYLNGCITSTFPKVRTEDYEGCNKIICVDINDELKEYIPKDIASQCEFITQMVYDVDDAEQVARDYYRKYIDEAKLVITSRLHCAIPCMAAGIPVVLMKENYSFRFPWLNKLLPVYTGDKLSEIDWNPTPVQYEDLKKRILENAKKRILAVKEEYESLCDISYFFEKEENEPAGTVEHYYTTEQYIRENWSVDENIEYSFWGITQPAYLVYEFVRENYPNAKLKYVYDKNKRVQFCGLESKSPEDIVTDENTFVFVTSASAYRAAETYFKQINKTDYMQCSGDSIL